MEYLVGPHIVEYIEMKVTGQGDSSFIFAKTGGHDLSHEFIIKAVEERLDRYAFHNADEVAVLNYESSEGQMRLQLCSPETSRTATMVCIERGTLDISKFNS